MRILSGAGFTLLVCLVGALRAGAALGADATTQPSMDKPPAWCVYKVEATPHFFQKDPRLGATVGDEGDCVPTAISNSLVYFGTHGFARLLPIPANPELSEVQMIQTLASADYMDTGSDAGRGTTPSGALTGLQRYVPEHGYKFATLQYAGWRRLRSDLRSLTVGSKPELDWIKSAIVTPKGAAWLEIGYYARGDAPNHWKRMAGHTVAAVGYGTDGSRIDPSIFIVDNSAIDLVKTGQTTRSLTLAQQAIALTPSGPIGVIPVDNGKAGPRRDLPDSYRVTGPGVPYSPWKYDAAFLDGAIVMVIGE